MRGWFSPSAVPAGWFEETAQPAGWFNYILLNTAAVTGTGALTIGAPAVAASGTVAPPAITGTGAITIDGPTVAASGTVAAPGVTGTGAIEIGGPVLSGAGTVTGGTIVAGLSSRITLTDLGREARHYALPKVVVLPAASRSLAWIDVGRSVRVSDAGRTLVFWGNVMRLTFPEPYDPSDVQSYTFDLTGALATAEGIASVTVAVEAGSPGSLTIGSGGRAPAISGKTVTFWLTGGDSSAPAADVGIVLTAVTDSTPSRTLQRTGIVQVRQR